MRPYMRANPQKRTPKQKEARAKKAREREQNYYGIKRWRDYVLKRYGITSEQYEALLSAQGGHCVFCKRKTEENGSHLAVDHDKQTGRVRGILCRVHNVALGALGDTEAALLRAAEYLRED